MVPPRPAGGLRVVLQLHGVQGFAKKCSSLEQRFGAERFDQRSEAPGLQGLRLRKLAADVVFVFGIGYISCVSLSAQPNSKTAVRSGP